MFDAGGNIPKKTEISNEKSKDKDVATIPVTKDEKVDEVLCATFSYTNVCKELVENGICIFQDAGKKFAATHFPGTSYIEFRIAKFPEGSSTSAAKVGFKIYVAVDDSNDDAGKENVAKFWNILTKYLIENTKYPIHIKGVIPGIDLAHTELNKNECGKQFVLYYFLSSGIEWQKILTNLTEKMVEAGIKPTPQSPNTIAVTGSSFFSLGQNTAPNSSKKGRRAYIPAEAREQIPMTDIPKNLQDIVIKVDGQRKKPTVVDLAVSSPAAEEPKTTVSSASSSPPKQHI